MLLKKTIYLQRSALLKTGLRKVAPLQSHALGLHPQQELIEDQNENNLENDIIGEDVIGEDVDNFEEDNDISSNQDFIEANKDSFDDEENSENVSSTEFIDILENESEIDEENEIDDQINIEDKNKDNEE